jgi:nucleotide-binding universal stress UspA family protein
LGIITISKRNKIAKEDKKMKVLVEYDGTLQAKDALKYGVEKVTESGGEIVALHVFKCNMFVDYDVFGAEEAGRAEALRFAAEAKRILEEAGKGLQARVIFAEGNPEEETINYARENNMDLLLCSPRYKSIIRNFKKLMDRQGKEVHESTIFDAAENPVVSVLSQR